MVTAQFTVMMQDHTLLHFNSSPGSACVQVMFFRLFDAKPLPEPILFYCQLVLKKQTSVKFESKYKTFHS